MNTCGTDSIEKTTEGRLRCIVCNNIGGTGAVMHLNYDGTFKKGPDGLSLATYMKEDGTMTNVDPYSNEINEPTVEVD